ncbi:MAG: PAS domain-containing sensor histidine kinase [Patescibacteria group bacterium]
MENLITNTVHQNFAAAIRFEIIGLGIVGFLILFALASWAYVFRLRKKQNTTAGLLAKGQKVAHSEKVKADLIISAIQDGVVVIGADKIIQVFNGAASEVTAWPAKDAVSLAYQSVLQLIDEHNVPYTDDKNPFEMVFNSKIGVIDNAAYLLTKTNQQIPINLSVSPLISQDGVVEAVVGIFRNVSAERRQEQQRADFISTASHEMRTPVAAIEGYLALALNEKVSNIDGKARVYLEKAHSSTQHLGKLFQDLLTSAKAEDGRLVSHPVVVEIGSFLEQVTDSLRFSAEKSGLQVEFLIGASDSGHANGSTKNVLPLYFSYLDPDRLREVVTNLFDNAVKYTDQGRISVGLTGNDKVVQLYVKDTGHGIPTEDVNHIFQKFYRVDNSATRTIGGTGLGLFICKKIIELYQGRIWVESKVDQGSTFYINLPRIDSKKATELQSKELLAPSTP